GSAVAHLNGTAAQLGKFAAYAELEFEAPGAGGPYLGKGIVAFEAANGDMLVGEVSWTINADNSGELAFHWRDAVTLGDGTIVASSGRFAKRRPPGVVTRSVTKLSGGFGGVIPVDGISL